MSFNFKLDKKCNNSKARAATFLTPHGEIKTPVFMPVGTNSAVKMMTNQQLENVSAQIILANSYHLFLRPGHKMIENTGGIHKWMNWNRPVLTDSGGFQVFSLANLRKINEDGVSFQDPKDGKKYYINPEISMEIQTSIGADIIMAFDECTPYPCEYKQAKESMELTHRWLERCFKAHKNPKQALFPIVQGSTYEDLRKESAHVISSFDAIGYAIGGVSVGEPTDEKNQIVEFCTQFLSENKPRYLMGVGTPEDLLDGVLRGIDMFDCVMPTRNARHGSFFTDNGRKIIRNKEFENDFSPLQEGCDCYACQNHTKAYIRHLFRQKEATASILMSIHNIRYLTNLMEQARQAIIEDRYIEFYTERMAKFLRKK